MSLKGQASLFGAMVTDSTPDNPVDISQIRSICRFGLGNLNPAPFDRYYAWLILFGVHPGVQTEWPATIERLMEEYQSYVTFFGKEDWHTRQLPMKMISDCFTGKDEGLAIIHSDIIRSGRLCCFFPPRPILSPQSQPDEEDFLFEFQEHLRRLERILFIYSKLNPGMGYMQGFNELAIPLYYVMMQPFQDSHKTITLTEEEMNRAECLAFHCFQHLMTRTNLSDFYMTQDSSSIIMKKLGVFESLVCKKLPRIGEILKTKEIHPVYYALRWFTLVFAQEHDFPSLLEIWDSCLAHFDKFADYLFYLGIAHMKINQKSLENDKIETVEALQRMRMSGKVQKILEVADKLWNEDKMEESVHRKSI